jgi:hypothetical protein
MMTCQRRRNRLRCARARSRPSSRCYYASSAYRGLESATKVNYRRILNGFAREHGHRLVAQFKREHVEIIIGAMEDRPGAGITLLKRLRTLCRFAMALHWINGDPTLWRETLQVDRDPHMDRGGAGHLRERAGRSAAGSGWPMRCCSTPASAAPTST